MEKKIEVEKPKKVYNKKRYYKKKKTITHHDTWVKRNVNPILRKLFGIEIFSAVYNGKVVGFGFRKHLK
jgi:hypothetical protein